MKFVSELFTNKIFEMTIIIFISKQSLHHNFLTKNTNLRNIFFICRKARIFDCNQVSHKSWTVDGEVEKVLWDHFNPFNFIVSNDNLTLTAVLCYTKVCLNLYHCLLFCDDLSKHVMKSDSSKSACCD